MKKIATLTLGCFIALAAQAQTFSDDFESYTVGSMIGASSSTWATWGGAGGGPDDAAVVNTDNHTAAGSKSLYFSSVSSSGGPQDVILPFAGAPLTTGQFNYTMWVKVPASKTAYFNFQGTASMGAMYTLDCWMTNTGDLMIQNSGTNVLVTTFPVGTWFELAIDANLNTNTWELSVDGVSQGTWSNANNQVYAIDLYPADAQASFWVDDVSFNVVPYSLPAVNGAANLLSVSNGLVGQTRLPSVKVRNLGTTTITSFTVNVDLNGGTPVPMTVGPVSIPSLGTYTVNYTTPFTLVAGPNVFTALISGVNGGGADGDASDDTITTTLTPVVPAAGKMVVAEEGTGTWCQWCPRGAVYMDLMNTKYAGYFAPIAVHNGDPMTNTAYDAAIGALISGYPSALVDRLPEMDPSAIENELLNEIVIAPKATMTHTDTFDLTTRVLDVIVNTTIQTAITGNYKIACVITEDDVTGTTGYAQSNAYAGGGAGPMGGYETLPNPVPASMMVYDHVAREIKPSFGGLSGAYGASAGAGATFSHNFSFTLPAAWDHTQMHIISLFIDPSGKIDNANMTDFGYVWSSSGVGITENDQNAVIHLFPNPATDQASLSLELTQESTVQVEIFQVNGTLVAKKDYGTLSGNMLLPVNMSGISEGMYFVNVIVNGKRSIHKLVKQ